MTDINDVFNTINTLITDGVKTQSAIAKEAGVPEIRYSFSLTNTISAIRSLLANPSSSFIQ